jgi:plasmid replication initiation protein
MKTTNKPAAIDITRWEGGSVILSNAINRGAHGLNHDGKRALFLAITKIDEGKATTNERGAICVEFHAEDFANYYPVHESNIYEKMADGVDNIRRANVSFFDGEKKVCLPWVQIAEYWDGEGRITVNFNPLLSPHITRALAKFGGYTLFKLKPAGPLSNHAMRIYAILNQYKSTGWVELEMDDLHQRLETPASLLKDFQQFKRKLLDGVVDELREKSKVHLTCEPIRTHGRRYKKIKFKFHDIRQPTAAEKKAEAATAEAIKKAATPTEDDENDYGGTADLTVAPFAPFAAERKDGKRSNIAWL